MPEIFSQHQGLDMARLGSQGSEVSSEHDLSKPRHPSRS
ncbi:hypothetical protein H1P_1240009 [Hyella patelloides LEGE 07179]|uniref:Uncharacterized protein n=1 Tax=Hyella patelloides LEGE 07179 TaxID=945734 RepID=A0A563VKQ5_9CYAN|nr:hypothetical protein H1P_1240009 [Hyella patelloides LEGE 07179]